MSVFMDLAIRCAQDAGLETLPNPRVGAVIVRNNTVIAKGCTQFCGGLHAEAVALQEAQKHAKGASLYCTLEPCYGTWEGKHQAACAERIVDAGITEVYIACLDSNPRVHGKGVQYLQDKGVAVHVLEDATNSEHSNMQDATRITTLRKLNEVFAHLQKFPNSPFVHVKIAQTLDGKMTGANNTRVSISGKVSQRFVHTMRAEHQAILTGINTILVDNPSLTVRLVEKKSPAIIILDSKLQIDPQAEVLLQGERRLLGHLQSSVCIFTSEYGYANATKVNMLESLGITVVPVASETPKNSKASASLALDEVLRTLYSMGVYSVMVEAGPILAASFVHSGLASKITCINSSQFLGLGNGIGEYLTSEQNLASSRLYSSSNLLTAHLHELEAVVTSDGKDIIISGYTNTLW